MFSCDQKSWQGFSSEDSWVKIESEIRKNWFFFFCINYRTRLTTAGAIQSNSNPAVETTEKSAGGEGAAAVIGPLNDRVRVCFEIYGLKWRKRGSRKR